MKKPVAASFLSLILLSLGGCASVHPGELGEKVAGDVPGLKLSASAIEEDPNQTFTVFDITFENEADQWLRIESTEVLIGDSEATKLAVVVGDDLKDWASAMNQRLKLDAYNRKMTLAGVAAAGAIAGAIGSASDTNTGKIIGAAGELAVVGTLAYSVVDVLQSARQRATGVNWVPEEHVYEKFSVPGKMFNRKWVLITRPTKVRINKLVLRVKTADNHWSDYAVPVPR